MDEVRKSIKIFIESVNKQIKDIPLDEEVIDYNNNEDIEQDNEENNGNQTETDKNQQFINLSLALTKAEIKPYKEEPFVAQIFVSSQENKDIIDSVRKELTQFIMKRTRYPQMKLEVLTIDPNDKKEIFYTPVDKFKFFMKTTPAIETLKDNFKCEIKY